MASIAPDRLPKVLTPESFLSNFRDQATALGFVAVGVTQAVDSAGFSNLLRWIDAGYAGQMSYFADRLNAYSHPAGVLEGCRSVICLAFPYSKTFVQSTREDTSLGRVARYAHSGVDYHDVIHPKLKQLCKFITAWRPESHARGVVDTAPIMEREMAQLAGIGWRGKNTLLLNKSLGSYFFLACILTDIELPSDAPHATSHCGTCTACLDACPTHAFPSPGVLDATRCISYLTIENRETIPHEFREALGDWFFGCDICQEVCPWNWKSAKTPSSVSEREDRLEFVDLLELFYLSDEEFRVRFRKTPLWRTKRRGLLRNAAIVLGNQNHSNSLDALRRGAIDEDEIVREASQWAISKMESHQNV